MFGMTDMKDLISNNEFREKTSELFLLSEKGIQEKALNIYKSKISVAKIDLLDALITISRLNTFDPDNKNEETIGITASIYKKLWEYEKYYPYLERAIYIYKYGYENTNSYWCGENYAMCLDHERFNHNNVNNREKELEAEALRVRLNIIEDLDKVLDTSDINPFNDVKWISATLANCYLATGNLVNYNLFEERFYELSPKRKEVNAYENNINHIKSYYYTKT